MPLVRQVLPASRRSLVVRLTIATGIAAWTWLVVHVLAGLLASCSFRGVSRHDIARLTMAKYAFEAYPSWRARYGGDTCPSLAALDEFMDRRSTKDPWGNAYEIVCLPADGPAIVMSAGEDGRFGTDDDLRSDVRD